jgi:hypothetical protein
VPNNQQENALRIDVGHRLEDVQRRKGIIAAREKY